MDHLLQDKAPISSAGWEAIDEEAKSRLKTYLAARKLVDFDGPKGWSHSATNLGRVSPVAKAPADGVSARQRRVLPLVELRAEFTVSRNELDDVDRGAADADLADLDSGDGHSLPLTGGDRRRDCGRWPGDDRLIAIHDDFGNQPVHIALLDRFGCVQKFALEV